MAVEGEGFAAAAAFARGDNIRAFSLLIIRLHYDGVKFRAAHLLDKEFLHGKLVALTLAVVDRREGDHLLQQVDDVITVGIDVVKDGLFGIHCCNSSLFR